MPLTLPDTVLCADVAVGACGEHYLSHKITRPVAVRSASTRRLADSGHASVGGH